MKMARYGIRDILFFPNSYQSRNTPYNFFLTAGFQLICVCYLTHYSLLQKLNSYIAEKLHPN